MAVEKIEAVAAVSTDMRAHTLTVSFDDEKASLDDVIHALNGAGYTVPKYEKSDTGS